MMWGWGGKKEAQPDIVNEMLTMIRTQSDRNQELMMKLLDHQKDQNETTKLLLGQYLAVGSPTSSTLDNRLFEREDDIEWDEIVESPFKGI